MIGEGDVMLKPIDIHNAEFKRTFKGYSEEEVDAFLAKVVGEYEQLFQENKRLRDEVQTLKSQLGEFQSKDDDIHGLIALAKQTVEEARETAKSQADNLVADAKLRAEREAAEVENELQSKRHRIQQLSREEKLFKERMRQLMETFWSMLERTELESVSDDTKVYRDLGRSPDSEGIRDPSSTE